MNQKISDLISNAEMEQNDYRRGGKPNVFFGEEKRYLGMKVNVFVFNTVVLIGSTLGLLGLLHWILRRQLEVRRSGIVASVPGCHPERSEGSLSVISRVQRCELRIDRMPRCALGMTSRRLALKNVR